MRSKDHSIRRWLSFAAGVLLLATLFAAAWVRQQYEHRLWQRISSASPLEISALSSPPADSDPVVMLLGDSRMAQWGLPNLRHWRVVNAGKGGLTTREILLCTPKLLDGFRPSVVVLQAGINDLKYIGLRPGMAADVVSLAMRNVISIVAECERRHCKVFVLQTWPAGKPTPARWFVWNKMVAASVIEFNRQLEKLDSPEEGVHVIDLLEKAELRLDGGLYLDTLHFKPEMYARLSPVLEKELEAVRTSSK